MNVSELIEILKNIDQKYIVKFTRKTFPKKGNNNIQVHEMKLDEINAPESLKLCVFEMIEGNYITTLIK